MKFPLLFLALLITSCRQNEPAKIQAKNSNGRPAAESHTIDSLKWSYYVYNYRSSAAFKGSGTGKTVFKTIACDIEFDEKLARGTDSTDYYFRLVQPGYKFTWVLHDAEAEYMSIWSGSIVPRLAYGGPEYIVSPDSIRFHYKRKNEEFIKFLKNYNGEMGNWLKAKAIEKQIIAN